jgi:hypothetical protein
LKACPPNLCFQAWQIQPFFLQHVRLIPASVIQPSSQWVFILLSLAKLGLIPSFPQLLFPPEFLLGQPRPSSLREFLQVFIMPVSLATYDQLQLEFLLLFTLEQQSRQIFLQVYFPPPSLPLTSFTIQLFLLSSLL